jgi:hypothetical protein
MSWAKAGLDATMAAACFVRGQGRLGLLFAAYAVGDIAAGLLSK